MTDINYGLYTLAATTQMDSAAGSDGLIAFQTIRSDTFDSTIDTSFYTSETGNYNLTHDTNSIGGNSGGKVKLRFAGNALDTADAIAQLSFTFQSIYSELEIEYDLFIPANYSHTVPSDNANNNKFFRLWQTTYGSMTTGQHCGASMFAVSGNSRLQTEVMHFGSGIGPGVGDGDNQDLTFIGSADKGQWVHIKIHAKAPTVGNNYSVTDVNGTFQRGDGFIKIYKNNALSANNVTLAAIGTGAQGWKTGYLMGAANSGFRVDTEFYIDNLLFRGKP